VVYLKKFTTNPSVASLTTIRRLYWYTRDEPIIWQIRYEECFRIRIAKAHCSTSLGSPTLPFNTDPNAPAPPSEGTRSLDSDAPAAPQSYSFQYSNCTGRRKALLIGINYFRQRGQLRGCINDVKNMSAFLHENFGYQRDDMVILTDDQQNIMSQPTKQNILRAMHWLVKDAQPNDSLFFHYSGE
jgi:hypothetical protein